MLFKDSFKLQLPKVTWWSTTSNWNGGDEGVEGNQILAPLSRRFKPTLYNKPHQTNNNKWCKMHGLSSLSYVDIQQQIHFSDMELLIG
jgi:hypothetical protein